MFDSSSSQSLISAEDVRGRLHCSLGVLHVDHVDVRFARLGGPRLRVGLFATEKVTSSSSEQCREKLNNIPPEGKRERKEAKEESEKGGSLAAPRSRVRFARDQASGLSAQHWRWCSMRREWVTKENDLMISSPMLGAALYRRRCHDEPTI